MVKITSIGDRLSSDENVGPPVMKMSLITAFPAFVGRVITFHYNI